jgi:GTP-binding protein
VIVIDASEGISDQDSRICGYAFEKNRGIVIAVNKWDLVKRDPDKKKKLEKDFELHLGFISFAPRLDLSALTGERVMNLLGKIDLVYDEFSKKVETPAVNKALEAISRKKPPPRAGRCPLKLSYATQIGVRPPTFALFTNRPGMLHFSYHRFLINQFREHLGLGHVPIKLVFKKK